MGNTYAAGPSSVPPPPLGVPPPPGAPAPPIPGTVTAGPAGTAVATPPPQDLPPPPEPGPGIFEDLHKKTKGGLIFYFIFFSRASFGDTTLHPCFRSTSRKLVSDSDIYIWIEFSN